METVLTPNASLSPLRLGQPTNRAERLAPMAKLAEKRKLPDRDWLYELSNLLQTTLQVQELIRLFSGHVQALVLHDGASYEYKPHNVKVDVGSQQRFSCTYDVVLMETYLGTLTFTRRERFSDSEMSLIEYVLVGLVHPLRNATLYNEALRVASKDPLTNVSNRANLDAVLDRELELAKRHEVPLSVIMVDVDRFKSINDTYGHVVGDYVLKALADCMVACARDSDIVFRYGGEEFIIVLSNTSTEGATNLAERIRSSVEALNICFDDNQVSITVSLGVATYTSGCTRTDLLANADRALYASKQAGRNQVTRSAANSDTLSARQ